MDISFATAGQIARAIKSKKLSALEAVDFSIARIEAFDDALNAVVVRDFERARATAKAHDRAHKKLSSLPPLFGVPMTVKESFDIAGLPTTWGVESARGNIAKADALAVQRFKAAGAIILGKTNVPVMLSDWQSSNPIYGTTNNPWDVTRSPGGSSGGSAASLAAGFAAMEAGSDIGASLRDPAHYCGIYAHKPTYGVCSPRGHSLSGNAAPTDISVIGPMARSARDTALGFSIMAGPDATATGWQLALPKPAISSLQGLRVAIMATHEICPVETEISESLLALGKFLKKSGAKVSYTARPAFNEAAAFENYMLLLNAALSARMPEPVIERMRADLANNTGAANAPSLAMARGMLLEHRIWLRLNEERAKMRLAWIAFFQDYDVLISPVGSTPAVAHDHSGNMGERSIMVNNQPLVCGQQLFWAGYSCNFGLPATSAPLGMSAGGLPYGMQIIGAPHADYTTLKVAALLEKTWCGFSPPPAYDL